jgi:hypothetical protein
MVVNVPANGIFPALQVIDDQIRKAINVYGLGDVPIAAHCQGEFSFAAGRANGEGNNRSLLQTADRADTGRSFVTIETGHIQIHENQIGYFVSGDPNTI